MRPIPVAQRFYIRDVAHLSSEIQRLGLALPMPSMSPTHLGAELQLARKAAANRFVSCAYLGNDAGPDGLPSAMSLARYQRYAQGGCGILISEPIAVYANVRRNLSQMYLGIKADPGLGQLVDCVKAASSEVGISKPLCLLQLDDTIISVFRKSPDYLSKLLLHVASAGWDGVQVCLPLSVCKDKTGEAAGVGDLMAWLRAQLPDMCLAARMCVYEADPQGGGFGANAEDYRIADPAEAIAVVETMAKNGLDMLQVQMTYPPQLPDIEVQPIAEDRLPQEHPLFALARTFGVLQAFRTALPDLKLMAGGFSWLREWMPHFAGAWMEAGVLDCIAMQRFALAYPDAPRDWLAQKRLDPAAGCTQCGACGQLSDIEAPVGCVLQHADVYGSVFRYHMRYQPEQLELEAARCHQCNPAPCVAATPGALPVPAMMRALAAGDFERAGVMLRKRQHLAEMCAMLSPYYASGEAACVETIFSGKSLPIRDAQYSAAAYARSHARVTVPEVAVDKKVVVIGGGPAGLAATAELLHGGVHVLLIERSAQIGGVPAQLIPQDRFGGNEAELDVMFRDALQQDRLRIMLNHEIRAAAMLQKLHADSDAVLLATGLWQDRFAVSGAPPKGVWGGLKFLEEMKTGRLDLSARRAIILAGGDCAMDAAVLLRRAGVEQLHILYPASRAEMPWCMDDSWFAQPGVNMMPWCRPEAYMQDADGQFAGLRVSHVDPAETSEHADMVLHAGLLVDCSDLVSDPCFQVAWPELAFGSNGCLTGQGAATYATSYPGLFAVGAIRNNCASIPQCVEEGTQAGKEIIHWLEDH